MFVLKSEPYFGGSTKYWDGYYTGDTYQYEGEQYAVTNTSLAFAKIYKHKGVAQRSCDALNRKVTNYEFKVVEVSQNTLGAYFEV